MKKKRSGQTKRAAVRVPKQHRAKSYGALQAFERVHPERPAKLSRGASI